MSEKPKSVEVGQRWHSSYGSGDFTVDKVGPSGKVEMSSGAWTTASDMLLKEEYTFLSSPTPAPVSPVCPSMPDTSPQPSPVAPTRVPPQALSSGEYRNIYGVAMSALEFIRSRPKPEPYICPVDDWDLLPDAGT